jgi:hypothetical protein
MVVLSVMVIVLLIAVLAGYLFVVGSQLNRIAGNLEESRDLVHRVVANAEPIEAGLAHINRTGGVIAGALPLLYDMAEGIVVGVTPSTGPSERPPARPASGRRRSRLHDGVGYRLDQQAAATAANAATVATAVLDPAPVTARGSADPGQL